jgi:hypothetical protein
MLNNASTVEHAQYYTLSELIVMSLNTAIVVVCITSKKSDSMKDFNLLYNKDSCILNETESQQ